MFEKRINALFLKLIINCEHSNLYLILNNGEYFDSVCSIFVFVIN